jgi:hypothetical protein
MTASRPLHFPGMNAAFRRRANERRSLATRLALTALRDLEERGIRAWIVGSLAKGSLSPHSDVDFVVDCPVEDEYQAFRTIEKAMGAFPFHLIPRSRVKADALPLLMEGALDAAGLVTREAQVRRSSEGVCEGHRD